jgi:hypothetical protein
MNSQLSSSQREVYTHPGVPALCGEEPRVVAVAKGKMGEGQTANSFKAPQSPDIRAFINAHFPMEDNLKPDVL